MPTEEVINFMLEKGYQYDELWDINIPRFVRDIYDLYGYFPLVLPGERNSSDNISITNESGSDCDCDESWDSSWDFKSTFSSQSENYGMETDVCSIYFPNEDMFYEEARFNDPGYGSSSNETVLEPDEQFSLDETNILSESSQQILARPLKYFAMFEEENLDTPENSYDKISSNSDQVMRPKGCIQEIAPLSLPILNLKVPSPMLSKEPEKITNMQLSNYMPDNVVRHLNPLKQTEQLYFHALSPPIVNIKFTSTNRSGIFWMNDRYTRAVTGVLETKRGDSYVGLNGDSWRSMVKHEKVEIAQVFDPGGVFLNKTLSLHL